MKIKKILAMCMAVFLSLQLVACSNSDKKSEAKEKIVVSGINGSVNFTPIYIGNEKGFFEKEGIDVDTVLFDNGPVQMEALASDSWDLGFTGVGGVLSGLVSYNAKLVGATNTDNGTQTVWVRSDGKIAAAGKGKNTINPEIVGDHDSWKGATVLCNSGTVLEYLLIKTLKGFDLDISDVSVITMDAPTANSAFQAGQGDASVITGAISFAEDKKDYTQASSGNMAKTGLECSIIANPNSYEDSEKYNTMVKFMKVYWDVVKWMGENKEEAAKLCSEFNAECGITLDEKTASLYLAQDPYYDAKSVLERMNTKSNNGDYSLMEEDLLGVMDFFISTGKYHKDDIDKFLNHMDTKLMTDILT